MTRTFTCRHCGNVLPQNPRLKNKQKYCSKRKCQKARMRRWKQQQYKINPSYRKKCQEEQKLWRKSYPSDQYQREYRKKHPYYVDHNRQLQFQRNKKRKKECASLIVKTDALVLHPRDDGAYMLSKVKKNMIVNRNALSLHPRGDGVYALFKLKEQKIVNRNALLSRGQSP